jgi:hypothetical protein
MQWKDGDLKDPMMSDHESSLGIQGQHAPELRVPEWLENVDGGSLLLIGALIVRRLRNRFECLLDEPHGLVEHHCRRPLTKKR